jgi:hypothetical protein
MVYANNMNVFLFSDFLQFWSFGSFSSRCRHPFTMIVPKAVLKNNVVEVRIRQYDHVLMTCSRGIFGLLHRNWCRGFTQSQ